MRTMLKTAKIPTGATLENFDFAFQPAIERSRIETLATGTWIRNSEVVLMQGPPGVGKSQVSIASRVRCHGEVAEVHGFAEVIADRT
ncbi:ATP-binding protein, partial [Cereibacter sphaeroides]|uniref:ATP-binding protein n=1 Tax=Cereibacter sphaeroides TaxID=1063 RepID=UPI002D7F937A